MKKLIVFLAVVATFWKPAASVAQWGSPGPSAVRATAPDGSSLALTFEYSQVGFVLVLLRLEPGVNQWLGLWMSLPMAGYGDVVGEVTAAGGPNAWIALQSPKINNAIKAKFPAGGAATPDPGPVASTNPSTPDGVTAELSRFKFETGADGLIRLVPR